MTITDRPSGTLVFLLLESNRAVPAAYAAFAHAIRQLATPTYELVCLTEAEAASIDVSPQARVYRLR